jgi:hypothetical protein
MILKHFGFVDSEDGLLLIGDALVLQQWQGMDDEDTQSLNIENIFVNQVPGTSIVINQRTASMWSLDGAGSVDIFSNEKFDQIILVRSWLDDTDDSTDDIEKVSIISSMPRPLSNQFSEFQITSGVLAIFWPIESGSCITGNSRANISLSIQNMMTETSGVLLPALNGRYFCFHDEVKLGQSEARRCHLLRLD